MAVVGVSGSGRQRTVSLGASMFIERSMKMMEEERNQVKMEQEGAFTCEKDELKATTSKPYPILSQMSVPGPQ